MVSSISCGTPPLAWFLRTAKSWQRELNSFLGTGWKRFILFNLFTLLTPKWPHFPRAVLDPLNCVLRLEYFFSLETGKLPSSAAAEGTTAFAWLERATAGSRAGVPPPFSLVQRSQVLRWIKNPYAVLPQPTLPFSPSTLSCQRPLGSVTGSPCSHQALAPTHGRGGQRRCQGEDEGAEPLVLAAPSSLREAWTVMQCRGASSRNFYGCTSLTFTNFHC